ncbi:MAG: hypothetical protein WC821_03835 [archaeon]|jgi:hypothetical protein
MKICFLGYKDNSVNIFKELGKALAKKISGLDLEQRFVSVPEDIPIVAMEMATESEFVFVFALLDDEDLAAFLKKKLIDVEIATKTRILKIVEEDFFSGLDEEDYLEKKESLVEEYAKLIVDILFNEQSFEPKDKDFSV